MSTSTNTPSTDADTVERLTSEGLIGLQKAARLYGSAHVATVTRHIARGVKMPDGRVVRLEAIRVGGRYLTSKEAVLRFFAAQQQPQAEPQPAPRSPAERNKAAARASKELDELFGKA